MRNSTASSNKKKDINLLTLDWLWGRPQTLLQRRNVSSVRVGLANDTKQTPLQNWGNPLSELHVPHRQCLAGISNAFSASFTSIWPSFPWFYCTPNKACLLCATPTGTDRVYSPGFPKIVYWHFGCVLIASLQCRFRAQRQMNQIIEGVIWLRIVWCNDPMGWQHQVTVNIWQNNVQKHHSVSQRFSYFRVREHFAWWQ